MKKRWIKSMLISLFLVGLGSWVYFFPYQKHAAQKATDQYLKAQGAPQRNIQSREIKRNWKTGGGIGQRSSIKMSPISFMNTDILGTLVSLTTSF